MTFFFNFKIKYKFLALFSIIFCCTGIIIAYSINSLMKNNLLADDINHLVEHHYMHSTNTYVGLIDLDKALAVAVSLNHVSDQARHEFDTLHQRLHVSIQGLRDSVDEHDDIEDILQDIDRLHHLLETQLLPALFHQDIKTAADLYHSTASPLCDQIKRNLDKIITAQIIYTQKGIVNLTNTDAVVFISILSAILTLILCFFSYTASKDIQHNIDRVNTHASYIAMGDLSHPIQTHRTDEFGLLLQHLEKMRLALSAHVHGILQQIDEITSDSETMQKKNEYIKELLQTAENSVITVASATDQMEQATKGIAANCENASSDAKQTNDFANIGLRSVEETVQAIHTQADHTRMDSEIILRLLEQSRDIGSIVETIDEIAAQTNLLALNAAIEAARAGEAGRGFSVVADEVRALAHRTTNSTHKISNMIELIQKDADEASTSMQRSVEGINALANNSATVNTNLQNIYDNVNNVNRRIGDIATAAEEQNVASVEISQNMKTVSNLAHDILEQSHQNATLVQHTVGAIGSLKKSIGFFKVA